MKTEQVLGILKVVSWIIFIGLCIKTGAIVVSFIISLLSTSDSAADLHRGMNFKELYDYSKWHYLVMVALVITLSGLKAYLFYRVIKIISRLNINHPFSEYIAGNISKMSGIALQIGITAMITNIYAKWLMKGGPGFTYEGGETEYLFLAGILFVIAVIFKRGIELQSENELTI
jgi:hypothetical protein